MRRAQDGPNRITSRTYVAGYAFNRNGTTWFRMGDIRRSAMRRWPDAADRDARTEIRTMLDAWITKAMTGDTETARNEPRYVAELVAAWADGPGETVSPNIRRKMAEAVRMAFGTDDECPLAITPLVDRIAAANRNTSLARSTHHGKMKMLKRLFRWGVDMGYLERNPVAMIGIKPLPRKQDTGRFTLEETNVLAWYMANRDIGADERTEYSRRYRYGNYALLWRWQFHTGMRIGETLKLRWRDITDHEIKIRDSKGKDQRNFPLAAFPVVASLVDELRTLHGDPKTGSPKPDARVFPWWSSSMAIQQMLNQTLDALRHERGGTLYFGRMNPRRTMHTFRASAEWHMEHTLGLSVPTICMITGHSIAVHEKHYRSRRSGKDLAELVAREVGKATNGT